ncbi:MAG: alpha/beta fold hydrolase [Sulfuritalea sp.]|nr:alpha/beta fold hydrolase [Sulfuritalea sp.]
MSHRKLHTLHRPAKKHNGHPPLVFVHGGYVHAGCWDVNFLPHFSKLGYHCHAINLSGHGASEGRENLNSYDLDHYAADVAQLVAELPAPPVLIGHSMGALVVQRFLEKGQAAAVIMMAPVPTTGLAGCSAQLHVRQPDFLREAGGTVRRLQAVGAGRIHDRRNRDDGASVALAQTPAEDSGAGHGW